LKALKHIFFFTAILAAFASCNEKASLPDLRESFGYKDTKPFGAYAAYQPAAGKLSGERLSPL
jgi:hypothetical protein